VTDAIFERVYKMLLRKYPHVVPGGIMKFLSKLAEYFAKGLQIISIFAGVTAKVLPGPIATEVQVVSQDLDQVGQVILDSEQIAVALGLKGPDKLKAAAPRVADILLRSAMLANHKIANSTLFTQGATKIADGMADVINSLHPDGIVVVNKQA
jgi:hypothetical protein